MLRNLLKHVRDFFDWWQSELTGLVRDATGGDREARRERVVVEVGDGERVARLVRPTGQEEIARVSTGADGPNAEAELNQALSRYVQRSRPLWACVPREAVLRRRLDQLPASLEGELESALRHQIPRLTPFQSDEVYYDYAVTERDRSSGRLVVELFIVPRASADAAVGMVPDGGSGLGGIGIGDGQDGIFRIEDRGQVRPVDFLRRHTAAAGSAAVRRTGLALTAAGLAMLIAAGVVDLWQRQQVIAEAEVEMARMREAALATANVRQRLNDLAARDDMLFDMLLSRPPTTLALERLSARLPDHTWLSRLSVEEDTVSISGWSRAPSELLPLIEQSEMFQRVRQTGAFRPDAAQEGESFSLSFELSEVTR